MLIKWNADLKIPSRKFLQSRSMETIYFRVLGSSMKTLGSSGCCVSSPREVSSRPVHEMIFLEFHRMPIGFDGG